MTPAEIDRLAKILWDYALMHHRLEKADCILVLGNHDIRTAEWGVRLFLEGYAPWLMMSGGYVLKRPELGIIWDNPEAEIFADRAVALGVPREKIIIENESKNTGENFVFSEKVLKERRLDFKKFIVVQKPYMERRTWVTGRKRWPDKELIVTSPRIPFEKYINGTYPREYVINHIVGDFQRVMVYPKQGFTIEQDIPIEAKEAYQKLVEAGYDRYLVK